MRVKHWLLMLLGVITVTAFAGGPTPTPASPTPTATPSLPVLAGTPVPLPNEPITPENVDRIQQLAMWGKGRIEHLAYSPDGKILAVGTTAGVWLYDAETLAELRFINTGNFVGSLAFTGDGTKLVTDVGASAIITWDVATGEKLNSVRVRDGYQGGMNFSPGSVAFSPGGNILAAALDDQKIGLWANQGEKYLSTLIGNAYKLALSPDQKLLAAGSVGNSIQIWDVATGTQLYTVERSEFGVSAPVFSPPLPVGGSSKMLLAASGGAIKLWDAQTGTLVKTLDEPDQVTALAFSSDGTLLATCSADNESNYIMRLWQVSNGTLLHTFHTKHIDFVNSLIFSPDSNFLISGSWDGAVQRWDTKTGILIDKLQGFGRSAAFAGRTPGIPLPAFFFRDRMFISNPFNNQIELWDLKDGQMEKALVGHKSLITNLALSTEGNKLVSSERWDNTIRIWNPVTGQNSGVYEIYVDTGYGKTLAISPDGQLLAVGEDRTGSVVYKSANLDQWIYRLPGDNGSYTPAFSPDGQKIASVSGLDTVAVSKAETGEVLYTLIARDHSYGLAFSPDSRLLATGTRSGKVQLWEAATGTPVATLNGETGNQVDSLAWSPDGRLVAAGLQDTQLRLGALTPTIELWEVKTGKLLTTFEGYQANIVQLAFSPDGGLLASAALDGTMRLWGIPPQ